MTTSSYPAAILVVDDNEAMLHAVSRLLTHAGYKVVEARSGAGCLEAARVHLPDLILLDVQLPDIDGIEVLKKLKADPALSEIFVVHLSAARTDAQAQASGLESGADGYIAQPVENRELVARVRAFLRHKKTIDALRESEARYRLLFESNPQPMWIYDPSTRRFIAVNDSAIKHYGYSAQEFLTRKMDDLVEVASAPARKGASLSTFDVYQKHRTKSGTVIDVEISEHRLRWGKVDAVAALIADVTQLKQIEAERERLIEKYKNEIQALEEISRLREAAPLSEEPARPLQEVAPGIFSSCKDKYGELLDLALDRRIFKVEHNVSDGLREVAVRLCTARATPRDVIDIHCAALRQRTPNPELPQAQGYMETGRLTLIELMGCLVNIYREQMLA